jgi:coenzyme F420-reducing hydrogenase alpha subunit
LQSIEHGLGLTLTPQTKLLRLLLNYGLMIRDHGLHLYVFVLPDFFNRESILAFDETNTIEHELLHDCFAVKEAGNKLGIISGGRSVHANTLTLGGFTKIPAKADLTVLIPQLEQIRPAVLRLITLFENDTQQLPQKLKFLALTDPKFSFLEGVLKTSDDLTIPPESFAQQLERVDIPYSQATGFLLRDTIHMVGALARINLNRQALHPHTKRDATSALKKFPSNNIFHNNLAQAIEMLHAIDTSIDLIAEYEAHEEPPPVIVKKAGVGVGIIEAPRGTLCHRVELTEAGTIKTSEVIVPTGQNQIGIERAIGDYVQAHISASKEELTIDIQKIIRAYDPCMSCATHFLKIRWQ